MTSYEINKDLDKLPQVTQIADQMMTMMSGVVALITTAKDFDVESEKAEKIWTYINELTARREFFGKYFDILRASAWEDYYSPDGSVLEQVVLVFKTREVEDYNIVLPAIIWDKDDSSILTRTCLRFAAVLKDSFIFKEDEE